MSELLPDVPPDVVVPDVPVPVVPPMVPVVPLVSGVVLVPVVPVCVVPLVPVPPVEPVDCATAMEPSKTVAAAVTINVVRFMSSLLRLAGKQITFACLVPLF
jgi:hypothetical protein